jgi:hypothetical protein
MSNVDELGVLSAEELADELTRRADMLRRAVSEVQGGHASSVVAALCKQALRERAAEGSSEVDDDAEPLSVRLIECFGEAGAAVRYLVNGRPPIFGGRTPLSVIADGDSPLLLYSLAALQHGLGA